MKTRVFYFETDQADSDAVEAACERALLGTQHAVVMGSYRETTVHPICEASVAALADPYSSESQILMAWLMRRESAHLELGCADPRYTAELMPESMH